MNSYLNLGDCVELEEYATKSIVEKCSFKALNSRGEIVGVTMNGIVKKPVSKSNFVFVVFACVLIIRTLRLAKRKRRKKK